MVEKNKKLLSILIPTYNRAKYLDNCLNSIFSQLDEELRDKIEVIVSDNASTDDTKEVMEKYSKNKNIDYNYSSNFENLGPDRNFYKLVLKADSKYCWLFSDDEYLGEDGLKKIINILENAGDLGLVHLKNNEKKVKIQKIEDSNLFLQKINYQITFITANIFNKTYFDKNFDYPKYFDGFMSYNYYYLYSIFKAKYNLIYEDKIFYSKNAPNGGYKLFEVFGYNLYIILKKFKKYGMEEKTLKKIKKEQCISFFPFWILLLKKNNDHFFKLEENIEFILDKEFNKEIYYKIIVKPILNLNYFIGKIYYLPIRVLLKIRRIINE